MAENTGGHQLRAAVVGMGPVGTILAAHLIDAGAHVVLCDIDHERIDRMKDDGIRLEQTIEKTVDVADGCYSISDLKQFDLDLIAVAVKTPTLAIIIPKIAEITSDKMFVMCVQNGLDNELEIARTLGESKTLRFSINYAGGMSAPSAVKVTFFNPPNYIAALTREGDAIAAEIARLLTSAGLETKVPENIRDHIWIKAILNSALSPVCAITGLTMKEVTDHELGLKLVTALIDESVRVAEAEGLKFDEGFKEFCLKYLKGGGYHRPSMWVDLDAGLPTEIDFLNGRIAYYGRKHGLPTPYNDTITALVHMLELSSKNQEK
ncbi:MAG: ketopantoate reductase family protein [Candidatus Zixiibacteriota bacterium]|nr:MAG: ketopantoate reductase family protein [candidate division Zixibacteria bacterium]